MSSLQFGWVLFAGGIFISLASGLRFRRGTRRGGLSLYRNPWMPRIVRHIAVAGPVVEILLLPFLALSAFATFDVLGRVEGHRLEGILLYASAAYLMMSLTVLTIALFRPPNWLIPRWVREDDLRVGYESPPPTWFDWLSLVVVVAVAGSSATYLTGTLIRVITES